MADMQKPIPVPSVETKPYWDNLRDGRFTMPKCSRCGHMWFPPSLLCPACHHNEHEWVEVSGRGVVFSFVVFHRVYHKAFADEVPYVVALVELEEGPRLISNIVGVAPEHVHCGMALEVVLEKVDPDVNVPKFAPARAASFKNSPSSGDP